MDELMKHISGEVDRHVRETTPEVMAFGEVFTPHHTINDMLDVLPASFWCDPGKKILDPCSNAGNFHVHLLRRLMDGLSEIIPDASLRMKHILSNMLYACEIQYRNVDAFMRIFSIDGITPNIYSGSFLPDDFAYAMESWGVSKFDLIVGNPPYQVGKDSRSAKSIYHSFVSKSTNISSNVLMITPSKWYSNPSMSAFRRSMLQYYGLKILNDITDPFDGVDIKGGVSYFWLEEGFSGECLYNGVERRFDSGIINTDSKLEEQMRINGKLETFSTRLKSDSYFGIRNIDERVKPDPFDGCCKCYLSEKNGGVGYIGVDQVSHKENFNKYKVFMPTASGSKNDIGKLGRIIIGLPGEVCSTSFVHFAFDSLIDCENFVKYINTDEIKRLIAAKKQTQLVKKDCFSFVPVIDLSVKCC